jgi:hypothetical protein
MNIIILVTLIALGLLGIAGWLKSRQPEAAGLLAHLEKIEGWVGLVGLALGIYGAISLLFDIGAVAGAPIRFILAVLTAMSMIGLGLVLSITIIKQFASGAAAQNLQNLVNKVAPFKMMMGALCLIVAVWMMLT